MNISVFWRSEGAGIATMRKTRGLTRSVMALIVAPFEQDDDALTRLLDPILQLTKLYLQLLQLLLVGLSLHLAVCVSGFRVCVVQNRAVAFFLYHRMILL